MNKELRERLEWLAFKCDDKAITPDVKDDIKYTLEYIDEQDKLINRIKEIVNKEITGIEAKLMIVDLLEGDKK